MIAHPNPEPDYCPCCGKRLMASAIVVVEQDEDPSQVVAEVEPDYGTESGVRACFDSAGSQSSDEPLTTVRTEKITIYAHVNSESDDVVGYLRRIGLEDIDPTTANDPIEASMR